MKRCNLLSLLTLALAPSLTQADELLDIYMEMGIEKLLDVNISSATGSDMPLRSAPAIATVITAKEIERSSARTLSEVLQMVPGLNFYLLSTALLKPAYDIRGLRTEKNAQILTLINGQPLDSANSGTPANCMTFPASMIQQVEVIRGPGSAIFGADAFAGVINIITKDPDYLQQRAQTGIRYGDFDTAELFANNAYHFENGANLGVNLSYMTSDGDANRIVKSDLQSLFDSRYGSDASLAPGRLNDQYETVHISGDLNYKAFQFSFWGYKNHSGNRNGVASTLDNQGKIDDTQLVSTLSHTFRWKEKNEWVNTLIYGYNKNAQHFVNFPPNTILLVNDKGNPSSSGSLFRFPDGHIGLPEYVENRFGYESTLYFRYTDRQKIRLSAGVHHIDSDTREKKNFGPGILDVANRAEYATPVNDPNYPAVEWSMDGTLIDVSNTDYIYQPNAERTILFTSVQDEVTLNADWSLTAGLRYDHFSDVGESFSPRVALLWHNNDDLSAKLLYGHAFRVPSLSDLYIRNNPAATGNPNMKPEKLDTIELGISYTPTPNFNNTTNVYGYRANDLIDEQEIDTGVTFINRGEQLGAGIETEFHWQPISELELMASYAYRWTEDQQTGKPIYGVAKHLGKLMANWHITENWNLNSDWSIVADIPREEGDARDKIDNYQLVNLANSYRLNHAIESTLGVRNLFDKTYVSPSRGIPKDDYPMPGRYVFAELKYRFD